MFGLLGETEEEPQTHLMCAGATKSGGIVHEELPVELISDDTMRVLASPGLVQGIARGDVIRILDKDNRFEVVSRAGNVSVQIFCCGGLAKLDAVKNILTDHGIGEIDGATDRLIVLTFPVSDTFSKIEMTVESTVSKIFADCWQYGNVYTDDEVGEPLNWWRNSESGQ